MKEEENAAAGLFIAALFILLVCVVSAIGVVYPDYVARSHFIHLEGMLEKESVLKIEAGRLLLEEGSLSSLALVEKKARTELLMQVPLIEQVEITYVEKFNSLNESVYSE